MRKRPIHRQHRPLGRQVGGVCSRVGQVVDEDGGTLAHGQDGVGLDLGIGGEDALGEPSDNGFGEAKVLWRAGQWVATETAPSPQMQRVKAVDQHTPR